MRILQIHNYYQTFGGECHVVDSEKNLLEQAGHTVHQFSKHSKDINTYPIYKKIKSYLNIPFNQATLIELTRCIQEFKPDIAHVHNVFPLISMSAYSTLKSENIPTIQTIHNFRFLCPNGLFFTHDRVCVDCQNYGWYKSVQNKCMRNNYLTSFLYANAISRAWKQNIIPDAIDQYIALNNFSKQKLIQGDIPESRISICGNYTQEFSDTVAEKGNYILYLGRLSAEKGLFTLLDAMHTLPDIHLKIAGTGSLEQEISNKIQSNNLTNVELIGFVSGHKKLELLSEALCLVVPSECYENFPISVLESLALGTPVIASKIGGLPELVEHGITGMLFDAGNFNKLAESIHILLNNPLKLKNISQNAIATSNSKFGPDRHYKQLIEIYQKTILRSEQSKKDGGAYGS